MGGKGRDEGKGMTLSVVPGQQKQHFKQMISLCLASALYCAASIVLSVTRKGHKIM